MIKTKKQMFIVVGSFLLVILLGTTTYAFFNYTRTGTANTIQTGRIAFNTTQGPAINLTNMFPIDVSEGIPNDNTKVGSVTINVTGDTTYSEGIEYLVSAVNVNNTIGTGQNEKSVPISIDVSFSSNGNGKVIGTIDEEYYDNRGGNASVYKILASDTISNNQELLVGYIKPDSTGIDGNIVIRAYLDKSKILISDTYPEQTVRTVITTGYSSNDCEAVLTGVQNASTYCASASSLQDAIDNEDLTSAQITLLVTAGIVYEYTDGTPGSIASGKTVFTTEEWNSLQTNGISFQIKVEANEGIWVEEDRSVNAMNAFPAAITNEKTNIKEVYFSKIGPTRMQNEYEAAVIKADLTYNNEGKVLAWLEENPLDNTKYNLIIASDGDTYLTTGAVLFQGWENVTRIDFNNINTSRVNNMVQMFDGCTSLLSLNLEKFDTSHVGNFAAMFRFCSSITDINLLSFDISSATGMQEFLKGCTVLTSIDLSSFNPSHFQNYELSGFFYGCTALETIYVSNIWDISNINPNCGVFDGNNSLVGGNGTIYDSAKYHVTMAVVDTPTTEGYLTLKTN